MGAGDEVPERSRQIGCDVTLLGPEIWPRGDLSDSTRSSPASAPTMCAPDLRANQHRLLDTCSDGGTLVVQYNVARRALSSAARAPHWLDMIGPYPHATSAVSASPWKRRRCSFSIPTNPLLHEPNEITEHDFDGWVQERGLYFAIEWDPQYQPLFESHDPGEKPLPGGTLYARYGKGAYVFTAYSWFRELPAGVPGAYRIFANLLSAGKTRRASEADDRPAPTTSRRRFSAPGGASTSSSWCTWRC